MAGITHGVDYSGVRSARDYREGRPGAADLLLGPGHRAFGAGFYQGTLFPEWKSSALVGGLRGMLLDRLTLSGDKVVAEEALLTDLHTRIRDVRVGADGAVYVLTDTGTGVITTTPRRRASY